MFNINHSVHNPICKIHLKERLATPWNGAVGDTLLQQELLGILPLEMALSNWKWPIWPSINCFSSEDLRSAIVNKHLSHLFWSYSAICSLFEAVFKISDSCLQRRRNWGLICTYQLSPPSLCLKNKRLQKKFAHFQSADRLCKFSPQNAVLASCWLCSDFGADLRMELILPTGYSCLVHKHLINEPPE